LKRISPKIASRLLNTLQDGNGKFEGAALDAVRRFRRISRLASEGGNQGRLQPKDSSSTGIAPVNKC